MKYLLDTCVISELIKKAPARSVVEWIQSRDQDSFHLSVLTVGEIQKGITMVTSRKKKLSLQKWLEEELSRRFTGKILRIDQAIASRWGAISGEAERIGRKVPVIDGLLAATALEAGLILVTRDEGHLKETGVTILNPWIMG